MTGKGVGSAVGQAECGRVPSIAEVQERVARQPCLVRIVRDHLYAGTRDQGTEPGPDVSVTCAHGQHHAGLQQAYGRKEATIRCGDDLEKAVGIRFAPENGDQGRVVDHDHAGKPASSYDSASDVGSCQASAAALCKLRARRSSNGAAASGRLGRQRTPSGMELGARRLQDSAYTVQGSKGHAFCAFGGFEPRPVATEIWARQASSSSVLGAGEHGQRGPARA